MLLFLYLRNFLNDAIKQCWLATPNLFNFDDFGEGIMENQEAQKLLKENGKNVFTIR